MVRERRRGVGGDPGRILVGGSIARSRMVRLVVAVAMLFSTVVLVPSQVAGAACGPSTFGFEPVPPENIFESMLPVEDTYVAEASPTANYGDEPTAYVAYKKEQGKLRERRAYFRFDTTSAADWMAAGYQIEEAKLQVYTPSTSFGVPVFTAGSSWDAGTLTWDNQPALGDQVATADLCGGEFTEIDITSVFADWAVNPAQNHGLALVSPKLVEHSSEMYTSEYQPAFPSDESVRLFVSYVSSDGDTTPPVVDFVHPTDGDVVFHIETVSATASDDVGVDRVEFLIDGALIGSDADAPFEVTWDTTTVTDGAYTITARAFDAAGNSGQDSADIQVGNGLESAGRLRADFEAGTLATDGYVRLGLYGITLPDLLSDRYQGPVTDPDGEEHGLAIEYLQHWEQLDSGVQADLEAYMDAWMVLDYETARDVAANGATTVSTLESSSVETQSTTWPECHTFSNDVTKCTHLSENFEIFYVPDSLEGIFSDSGVPDVDEIYREGTELISCDASDFGSCNQVPDYVDRAAAALEHGRVVYGDLGFRLPPSPSRVSIQDARPKVIPTKVRVGGSAIGWTPTIVINHRNNEYSIARHELFHLVQYEYVTLEEIGLLEGVWPWLEATAQWGSHQAQRISDQDDPEQRHYSHLHRFLGRPNWWLFTFEENWIDRRNPFRAEKRQYGAFIFAEYLEETLDGGRPVDNTAVERTWELIEAGSDAPGAVKTVIEEGFGAGSAAGRIADFHVDSYVLTKQGNVGFTDPDAPTWRDWLELRLGRNHPVAKDRTLMVGDSWDPTEEDRPYVVAGGAVYVEVNLDDGSGGPPQGQLVVDTPAIPEVAYSLIGFSNYPNLCSELAAPLRIDNGPGTAGHAEIALSGTCDRVVLVISHTSLEGGLILEPGIGNGVQVDWQVSFNELKTELAPYATFTSVDVVTAGVGALRDVGTGTIELTGLSGTVEQALLFWHGPTNSIDTDANATIRMNGTTVTGTHIGFGNDNCWGYANSQSYRADVTDLITGDGSYLLEDLIKDGGNININGASLIVFYDDGDPDNDVATYLLFEGNDSNVASIYDPEGWDAVLASIGYEGGPAALQFHVGDGQIWEDDDLYVNGTVIAPGPQVFDGTSVPGGDGPGGWGSLWDIRTFDIAALLSGGDNTLHVTTGQVADCLSLVAVSAIIGGLDAGPQVTSTAGTATVTTPTGPNQGGVMP